VDDDTVTTILIIAAVAVVAYMLWPASGQDISQPDATVLPGGGAGVMPGGQGYGPNQPGVEGALD
jgi:hypothetical protein